MTIQISTSKKDKFFGSEFVAAIYSQKISSEKTNKMYFVDSSSQPFIFAYHSKN